MVRSVPEGYHTVTPYLSIQNAAAAIDFYVKAFGAKEVMRMETPDGKIGHAEILIGDSHVMLADEAPELDFLSPRARGGSSCLLMIYVDDVDTVFKRAIQAGAKELRAVKDQFYGDRSGNLADPFGHLWTVATHVEDVPEEEMERRIKEMEQG